MRHSKKSRSKRREEAEIRQIDREERGDLEQIGLIKQRPGKSARERARIMAKVGH